MKTLKTLIATALLTYVALLNAQTAPQNKPANPLQEIVWIGAEQVGSINWENHTAVAFGIGKYPHDAVNLAQTKARAKRAALDTAQANL